MEPLSLKRCKTKLILFFRKLQKMIKDFARLDTSIASQILRQNPNGRWLLHDYKDYVTGI